MTMCQQLRRSVILHIHDKLLFKITNTMSLVDYPLFSWVVVIHSLHVSSFLEAHHQEIILPVQSACSAPDCVYKSTSDIVLVILKNYNDARNNECKKMISCL